MLLKKQKKQQQQKNTMLSAEGCTNLNVVEFIRFLHVHCVVLKIFLNLLCGKLLEILRGRGSIKPDLKKLN